MNGTFVGSGKTARFLVLPYNHICIHSVLDLETLRMVQLLGVAIKDEVFLKPKQAL